MKKITHKRILEEQVGKAYADIHDQNREFSASGYRAGKLSAFADYREWAVDVNYAIFNAGDGTVRSQIYRALQEGVYKFSPRLNRSVMTDLERELEDYLTEDK